jgi:uncharacterized protein YndB with AHSA1/START domain
VYRVYIKVPAERVWEALVTPEWTRRFGYGGDIAIDLRPGGQYVHYTSAEMRAVGAPDIAVDGEVIEADPPRKLVKTWRMAMDEGLQAEGFTTLTYELDEVSPGVTRLTVVHDLTGAPRLAVLLRGDQESEGAGGGWAWVLSDLKSLLETGTPLADA